jgi:phosphoribosylformimino-5-aminoimidazole carboxamide ribotide isomerase
LIIIPAIDLLDNECVRLYKGNYAEKIVYSKKPFEIARSYEDAGAKRLHIVDLDAAKGEGKNNRKVISQIRKKVSCTIEVGGGIRTEDDVRELKEIGADKLILGTVFARNPEIATAWGKKYGYCFIAGIDALDGKVKIKGWESDSGVSDIALAKKAGELMISEIIYTNISRDGALTGPDIERTRMIAEYADIPVILSGGISCKEDIRNVVDAGCPLIIGIIIGKAIYEQKVSVRDLIVSFQDES